MEADTEIVAQEAIDLLDELRQLASADTAEVINGNDIPTTIIHFDKLRNAIRRLAEQMSDLQKQVDALSYELIPTMFTNANVKTITVEGVGRVTVNVRWNASMVDRERAMQWLRSTGNGGMIIETVNAQTLGAWAKREILDGNSPPDDLFKVGTSNYVSITGGARDDDV